MLPLVVPALLATWSAPVVFALTVRHDATFTPDHILRVTNDNIDIACDQHLSVVVNGSTPGPVLRLAPGTASWIRVYNDVDDQNVTMHWHGLAQRMAPFSDGSPQAAQWPIPPGHFFDYEVETALGDSGTYFFHSHTGMQALSACGALIVEDCDSPPYDYDDERILQFSDYSPRSDGNVGGARGRNTDAILLNGLGLRSGDKADGSDSCSLAVIDVEPATTYRFRIIGATGLSHLIIGIDEHPDLTIIQVDGGEYVQPYPVEYIQLGSGQRYDVLLTTKSEEELEVDGKDTYFIQYETLDRSSTLRGYAALKYTTASAKAKRQRFRPERQGRQGRQGSSFSSSSGSDDSDDDSDILQPPSSPPLSLPSDNNEWLEYSLEPLYPDLSVCPTLDEVTRRVVIDAQLLIAGNSDDTVWQLAGLSWSDADQSVPLLVDIYQRGQEAIPDYDTAMDNYGWDPNTKAFPVRIGEVLEIVVQNTGAINADGNDQGSGLVEAHPFHIHGQHVWDVGSGDGTYDAEANEKKIKDLGWKPVRRDTSMLYKFESTVDPGASAGWRAWRIRVDYAGVWMLHCHTLGHMVHGMQSVWVNGDAADIMTIPLSQSSGYLEYGGDVYGNSTKDPVVYQAFDGSAQCATSTRHRRH
ncbi:L-ascorbate oxidase [Coniochaeta ligniaria NRRL 30616]|uniref:L-ascorbate oxidase n=1 Tax=Coniochaeta ligniaria NRRL 30616 TaxID=1408157 RepID=A0A1J7J4F0_9PEZI|nr:L-ascorbate oxidase [Coniochaeta ligniaria NRRL 30616]